MKKITTTYIVKKIKRYKIKLLSDDKITNCTYLYLYSWPLTMKYRFAYEIEIETTAYDSTNDCMLIDNCTVDQMMIVEYYYTTRLVDENFPLPLS